MSISNVIKALSVLRWLKQMPVGEGWAKPTEIIFWSGVSQSTIYRYMPKLEKLGYVKSKTYQCRKLNCKQYQITESGLAWFSNQKGLF